MKYEMKRKYEIKYVKVEEHMIIINGNDYSNPHDESYDNSS